MEVVSQAEDLQKKIYEIDLSWMDSVFRPDNEKRKNMVIELLKSIIKKTFVIGDYIKGDIPGLNETDY